MTKAREKELATLLMKMLGNHIQLRDEVAALMSLLEVKGLITQGQVKAFSGVAQSVHEQDRTLELLKKFQGPLQ